MRNHSNICVFLNRILERPFWAVLTALIHRDFTTVLVMEILFKVMEIHWSKCVWTLNVSLCFQEEPGEELRKRKTRFRRASDVLRATWRENNNAERIFNLLPERDTHCYSALIRGMVKVWPHTSLTLITPEGPLYVGAFHRECRYGEIVLTLYIYCGLSAACWSVSPQHGAYAKAFSMYTDMLNNRVTGEWQQTWARENST